MTSPGGTEVGRASIRVLPDVSGFRARLRAELAAIGSTDLKIDVDFDIDPAELQAKLARLRNKLKVEVDLVVGKTPVITDKVSLNVRLDIDKAYWRAQVASINPVRLRANVNVDIDEAEISRKVRRAIRRGSADVDVNGRNGDALGGVTNSFQLLANFGGRWLRYLLLAFSIAPLLAIAGAAITAAWGAAAAAISAIPALLFGIGAPLAVVVLGVDYLTEQFSKLKPEVDGITAAVVRGFSESIPAAVVVVSKLLKFLPESFRKVSDALGHLVYDVLDVLDTEDKFAQLGEVFRLVADTIWLINPALQTVLDTLVDVATISDGYKIFTTPLTEFANAFRASVSEIGNNGVLGGSLRELADLLGALARAFINLVENGIYVFFQAAPGVTKFVDSLTSFFARFDWERLGTATGAVFIGLADALNKVPQKTIDDITAAFEDLGALFSDPQFSGMLADLIGYLPEIIYLISLMTEGFVRGVLVLAGLAEAAMGVLKLIRDSVAAIADGWSLEDFQRINDQNWSSITEGLDKALKAAFDPINKEIPEQFGRAGDNIFHGFVRMDGSIREGIKLVEGDKDFDPLEGLGNGLKINNSLGIATENVLRAKDQIVGAATPTEADRTGIGTKYQELWGVVGIDQATADSAGLKARSVSQGIVSNLAPSEGAREQVRGGWAGIADSINGVVQTAVDAANNTFSTGFTRAANTSYVAASQVPPAVASGLGPLPAAVQRAMDASANEFSTGWNASFVATDFGARRVINRTAQVPGQIQNSMGPTSNTLTNAGTNIMNSLYNGLVSAYRKVQTFVGGIANWIARNKGPESVDRVLLFPAGQWIMQGLSEGLEIGFRDVMTQVQGMNNALQDSWTVDGGLFASALTEGVPEAIAKNEQLLAKRNIAVGGDLNATVQAEGFGIGNDIVSALEGWEVVIDANGITKLVNKTNTRKARR
jgi:hypothetical protein